MLAQPKRLDFTLPDITNPASTHRITGYEWGDEAASQTLVCVHGLTRNARDFDYVATALSLRLHVISLNMPGRGDSQWLTNPAGYSYPAYVANCLAVLAMLNLTNIHWLGTSMGGIIGLMLAASKPGLLRSLILNDIGCLVPADGLRRILAYAGTSTIYPTRADAEIGLRTRMSSFGITDETHWQHVFSTSIEPTPDGRFRIAYDPAILANLPHADAIADVDLWPLWPATQTLPVMLIRGSESDILTQETASQMRATHPNLTYHEVPAAGHAPALMDATQIQWIKDWLQAR